MPARGKTAQKSQMWVADFETCDSEELSQFSADGQQLFKQRVWLAGMMNLQRMQMVYFTNLSDFMEELLSRGNNQNKEVAFHNLKFDGSYIVPWLFENGYTSTLEKPKPGEFGVLVSDRNDWYSITIQVTKRRRIRIWDSAKLFPMQLRYLPDIYHTPTRKIEEDENFYEEKRAIDHIPTERELMYFHNDLQVLAEVLNAHIQHVGIRFKKTQAGQAFYDFEQSFKAWKLRFPPLDNETDAELRAAYWGGISYVPPEKAGKDFYDVGVMDINSSYPHKAAHCKMPYGEPVLITYDQHPDSSKFWVADVIIKFDLKPNRLPCIPTKAITEQKPITHDKWLSHSGGYVRMSMSSIDYVTIQSSYDFDIAQFIKTTHFKQRVHKELTKFVEVNNEIKEKNRRKAKTLPDGQEKKSLLALAYRAKITNNSFYGKFGEEIIKEGKTPYYDEEEDLVVWEVDRIQELTDNKKKYLPVAIAITAYGRQQLVLLANALREDFLYCDTDSVHYTLKGGANTIDEAIEMGNLELDPVKLGAWDMEGTYERGRYLRAKCYMEGSDTERDVTLAGLPADPNTGQFSKQRSCVNWDNFHIGYVIPASKSNKLRSVRTETGTKLLAVGFEIKEHDNLLYN